MIRKEESDKECLSSLAYKRHLWQEKEIKSVANICRLEMTDFLKLANVMELQPTVEEYSLREANRAIVELKMSKSTGSRALVI